MKRSILMLAFLAVHCGGEMPPAGPHELEVDAGADGGSRLEVDAGVPDGPCDAQTVAICDLAEAQLGTCCASVDEWQPVGGAKLCAKIAMGDANPAAACKQLADASCPALASSGACF
jgi:hypothetical protein